MFLALDEQQVRFFCFAVRLALKLSFVEVRFSPSCVGITYTAMVMLGPR